MNAPVVVDAGSSWCRSGRAGDSEPCNEFSTAANGSTSPIERGIVTNWDAMETLWQRVFSELNTSPEDQPVLLTDGPSSPKAHREKMTEIMFESCKSPAMHVATRTVLALYACGRTTGLVIESGDGVTHTVSIHEGFAIPNAIGRLELAGRDLTEYMAKILSENGIEQAKDIACDIKEEKSYIAMDFNMEKEKGEETNIKYSLPDGKSVEIGEELFSCPEALFQPSLLGMESSVGIHRLAFDSIKKCESGIHEQLFSTLVPAGGSTQFPGFDERLRKEISALASPATVTKIFAMPWRRRAAWIGGSIVASLLEDKWIKKAEYDETGPSIVHTKCA